jgi:hypothetical protein
MLEDIHIYKIYAITDLHALLFLIPVQQCCGARVEEPKLNCLPEP